MLRSDKWLRTWYFLSFILSISVVTPWVFARFSLDCLHYVFRVYFCLFVCPLLTPFISVCKFKTMQTHFEGDLALNTSIYIYECRRTNWWNVHLKSLIFKGNLSDIIQMFIVKAAQHLSAWLTLSKQYVSITGSFSHYNSFDDR